MNENRFYICEHCGNIVGMIHDAGKSLRCCGEKMKQLAPSADASAEKHTPIVKVEGNSVEVNVGSISHPITEEHSITWVYLQTDRGGQRKCLKQGSEPVVSFALLEEKPVAVYAYCNLHGMWKTEL